MNMLRYSLGIVQAHATQFDGPLFRWLARARNVDLTVYYTSPGALEPSYDPELQHHSGWDHDISTGYQCSIYPRGFRGRLRLAKELITAGHDLVIISGYSSPPALMVAVLGKLA